MKKLVVSEFLSLDGVMQAPGGAQEDTEGGFQHGGWQLPFFAEDRGEGEVITKQINAMDGLLLGRVTYQIFASYWPTAPAEVGELARKLNSVPKYVWSNTLQQLEWQNSTLMKGDMAVEVNKLKQLPGAGTLTVIGSGKLAQSLMQRGLVDEYALMIFPLVLGSGKRLFAGGVPPLHLKLVDSKITRTGIAIVTYQPANRA